MTSDSSRTHEARGMLECERYLVDEGKHHPDDERQRRDRIDEHQPDIGVEQAYTGAEQRGRHVGDDDGVIDQDRDRHHDGRDHADHQNGVAEVFAPDIEARDRVGEECADQQAEKRGRRAYQRGIAEALPDGEGLLGCLAAERRVERTEGEYLRIVVNRRLVRQPVRRPSHPLAGILERRRDHPEDREGDDSRPGEQNRVSHDPLHTFAPQPPCARRQGCCARADTHGALPSTARRWLISM